LGIFDTSLRLITFIWHRKSNSELPILRIVKSNSTVNNRITEIKIFYTANVFSLVSANSSQLQKLFEAQLTSLRFPIV